MTRPDTEVSSAGCKDYTNPYEPPKVASEIEPRTSKQIDTVGRIYLWLHVAAVAATAFASLGDTGELRLQEGWGVELTGAGLPFFFLSPGVGLMMVWSAIWQPQKYASFALAELLLCATHFFVALPMVQ